MSAGASNAKYQLRQQRQKLTSARVYKKKKKAFPNAH
jgi:hypothetical protein